MTEKEETTEFVTINIDQSSTEQAEEPPVIDMNYTRDDWYKLLSQEGYLKVLKQFALSGELQRSNLRSICWKVFLGCLPEDQSCWMETLKKSRDTYRALKQKHMIDPHTDVEVSLDLNVHNPLSLEEESPWNQYFQDNELKQTIVQDIVRTHPDQMFFRQQNIQNSMLDILFCYAKEVPTVGYRQGMHELLAPMLFILHAESRDDIHSDDTLSPVLKAVMDPEFIDADAYTLFSELMEGMQQFFLSASLEADVVRRQNNNNKHSMRPFESDDILTPTSAIARKLDKIHDLLLKRADEQLYYRLKDLNIPPQTYGIRWIRLLFGREFHLPSVLQLWDALFVEGPSLGLMDYVFVTMLLLVRDTLLSDDYSTCMQLLMKYPPCFEVSDLVQKALHLRNPTMYPNSVGHVREWTQLVDEQSSYGGGGGGGKQLQIQEERTHEVIKKSQKFANKTKSVLAQATKQMHIPTRPIVLPTKLSISKGDNKSKLVEGSNSTPSEDNQQEMIRNPKSRPRALSEIDRLKDQIEINDAKCLYCGRKMESILDEVQDLLEDIQLSEEKETPMYLAVAGLKQVRDLLLHKLPFSGELPDYDELTVPPQDIETPELIHHPLVSSNNEGENTDMINNHESS